MISLALTLALLGQDESAYDKAVESTVRLRVIDARGRAATATGVVVVGDGRIPTAYHTVRGAAKIIAAAPIRRDGRVVAEPTGYTGGVTCTLTDHSPNRDLALLTASGLGKPVALGVKSPPPGDGVFAIGNGVTMFRYAGGCVR